MDNKSLEKIKKIRQRFYGDPYSNHKKLSEFFAPVLREHWKTIKAGEPLPVWVVTLLLTLLKICRMTKGVYKLDNFLDAQNYLEFTKDFQRKESKNEKTNKTTKKNKRK